MKVIETALQGVLMVEPEVVGGGRGLFLDASR